MKKILLISAVVMTTLFSACNSGSKGLKTESDSLAYAIGLDLGASVKNVDSTLNVDLIARGIKDYIANKPGFTPENVQTFLREYFTVRKPAKMKAASDAFLKEIEAKAGIQKTESGLMYEIVAEGAEKAINDEDTVVVNYIGTLPNGTKFDSSYDRNEPATFPLNRVIPAWTEGMKLIGKGGKIKLYVPSELGYGEQGAGQLIGPNQALVFEVELIEIKPAIGVPAATTPAAPVKK